jgi:hypothetical protein
MKRPNASACIDACHDDRSASFQFGRVLIFFPFTCVHVITLRTLDFDKATLSANETAICFPLEIVPDKFFCRSVGRSAAATWLVGIDQIA